MYTNYQMIGGGNCSLCGSPGTNMTTCPLNPKAIKPNPIKHPMAGTISVPETIKTSQVSIANYSQLIPTPIKVKPKIIEQTLEEKDRLEDPGSRKETLLDTSKNQKAKKIMKQVKFVDTPPHGCAVGKIGPRPTMEDEHVTVSFDDGINLYAVFDGHGGARVSKFLVKALPEELYNTLKDLDLDDEKLVRQSIKDAYARIDAKINTMGIKDGSTAVAILQIYNTLYFINLGDSRAILVNSSNGEIVHTTMDQKPNDERSRITEAGGFVIFGRVNGQLAVARAFGDMDLKKDRDGNYAGPNAAVSSVPVITTYEMKPNQTYIAVLACDGLWDVMKNEDTASRLPPTGQLQAVCENLIDEALNKGSRDNVTVMVTVLKALTD